MKLKEHYQQYLDTAYQFAPFILLSVIDIKHPQNIGIPSRCDVCGNKRLRFLCQCHDKRRVIWYIGRDCYTELTNRQFREKLIGNS